ncbi:hypothetical protein LLG96_00355 [bacterium]|nr:hypothetical protein [bacterium]
MNQKVRYLFMAVFPVIVLFLNTARISAEPGRWEHELSGGEWRLNIDPEASWKDDDIYLPPVKIDTLPVHQPSFGWENLADPARGITVSVPGTVEEYYWSANGNPNGIAGDYLGVSWWSTTFKLDQSLRGKRIILAFESVNLRAEVYVNRKLAGYDVIGNTPFEFDVSDAVVFGGENRLDVRITDPVGDFEWNDEYLMKWGQNMVPAVHGFGGITGKVTLRATDAVHVDDIYVQNKPEPTDVDVFVTVGNSSGAGSDGSLSLVIHEWKNPSRVLWQKTVPLSVSSKGGEYTFRVKAPEAKLWDIDKPNLYTAAVSFSSGDGGVQDTMTRRFGFRFFTVGEEHGDKRYYLNGKRVFIFAAMTRGFWPKNGIFPTPEMARKDIETARSLGLNMMLFHRAIGQPRAIDAADELGMLTYEEPGGYMCNPGTYSQIKERMAPVPPVAREWRREKLRRMVIRDRSVPSMVIFNMDDLSWNEPNDDDKENIVMVHTLDPSRLVTFNCITLPTIPNNRDYPFKLHMKPFDMNFYCHGWTSPYHLMATGVYLDNYYRNPRYYLRYVIDPIATMGDSLYPMPEDEIIFLGEEGDLSAPVRLEKIKNELAMTGANGWRESEHLDWYRAYERFLDESGFRSSFPTVDDLTVSLGAKMHYFHGRILENTRISNKADAYVLNGWASAATHTDIVDTYRNPTGDPAILQHYTQPLYVAVKIRDKVLPAGSEPVADIYLVNEKNLRGKHTLELALADPSGAVVFSRQYPVNITGGNEFGQLLVEEVRMPSVTIPGYYMLKAEIRNGKGIAGASGFDDIFVVDYMNGPGIKGTAAVIDTTGTINAFLKASRGITLPEFDPEAPDVDCIIVGPHDFRKINSLGRERVRGPNPIMTMVARGATLIILDQADRWAEQRDSIHSYQALQYFGSEHFGKHGHFIAGKSPLLDGLPKGQALNWECQVFYRGDVWGLNLDRAGMGTVIALAASNRKEILTALARIPFGNGQIIISTLNIVPELKSVKPQSAVARKLFLNMLEYSR